MTDSEKSADEKVIPKEEVKVTQAKVQWTRDIHCRLNKKHTTVGRWNRPEPSQATE